MGVTGLLPFLQKASRPAKMKEFAGLNLNVCWLLADKDRVHIVLVQGQPLLLTSMSGFTRVPSGAILLYRDARKFCHFSNQPSVCVVVLRLWRRVNQLMPTWNMLWGELGFAFWGAETMCCWLLIEWTFSSIKPVVVIVVVAVTLDIIVVVVFVVWND